MKGACSHEEAHIFDIRSRVWLAVGYRVCPRWAGRARRDFVPPAVFQAAGPTADSIQGTVDEFRAALGNPNNGNATGPLPTGRREINWDGGGNNNTTTAPVTPFNVFLNTRGGQFTTRGIGLSQAPPSGGPQGGLASTLQESDLRYHLQHLQSIAPVHPGRQQPHRCVVLHTRHQWRDPRSGQGLRGGLHRCGPAGWER